MTTSKLPPLSAGRFHGKSLVAGLLLAVLVYAIVLLTTRSTFFGDTHYYEQDVLLYFAGRMTFPETLDFGHLIWRPLGIWLTLRDEAVNSAALFLRVHDALLYVNLLASFVCLASLWVLTRLTKGISFGGSILVLAGFVTTNGFINLSRSGSSWLPGLACILLSCCLTLVAERRTRCGQAVLGFWIAAALFSALAVVFWVPYVLATLAVVFTGLLDQPEKPSWKTVWRAAIRVLPLAALLVVTADAWAIHIRHFSSFSSVLAWVHDASHGDEAGGGKIVRFLFGLPRSFFIMGNDGVTWKQFLFHDPFARLTALDVILAGAWKLGLFYAITAIAGIFLLRDAKFRGVAIWAAAGIIPTIALAILFEAGSVERYLALYPMVFLCFGCLFEDASVPRPVRALLVVLLAAQVGTNLYANSTVLVDREYALTLSRIASLAQRSSDVTVLTVNLRDELIGVFHDSTYTTQHATPAIYTIVPPMYTDVPKWKILFAQAVTRRWEQGGEVWVSKRAYAAQPRRNWLWVENDDSRIHWSDIHSFVTGFATDAETGGEDGFLRLANTAANREIISASLIQP